MNYDWAKALLFLVVVVVSYLIGALPFGYLIARWRGVDILQRGSGNIGATNVGRVLGRRYGVLVFVLDFAKGALPVVLAGWTARHAIESIVPPSLEIGAGLAAFLGHLFPLYLRFRGGKGVATGAGVISVLLPVPGLAAFLAWVVIVSTTRYVSLASLSAAVVLCLVRLISMSEPFQGENRNLTLFCLVAAALIFARHRSNLVRLFQGTENRLRDTAAMLLATKLTNVLALGVWFGSVVFFSLIATPVVFQSFGSLPEKSAPERPSWLPDSFNKEQAGQLAGLAVGPIFPWYFLLQGVCGLVATLTAAAWLGVEPATVIHKMRFYLLVLALTAVLLGWPLAQKVSDLRALRYAPDIEVASSARAAFASWHTASLLLNFVVLILVTVAMALAARLPAGAPPRTLQAAGTPLPDDEVKRAPSVA